MRQLTWAIAKGVDMRRKLDFYKGVHVNDRHRIGYPGNQATLQRHRFLVCIKGRARQHFRNNSVIILIGTVQVNITLISFPKLSTLQPQISQASSAEPSGSETPHHAKPPKTTDVAGNPRRTPPPQTRGAPMTSLEVSKESVLNSGVFPWIPQTSPKYPWNSWEIGGERVSLTIFRTLLQIFCSALSGRSCP